MKEIHFNCYGLDCVIDSEGYLNTIEGQKRYRVLDNRKAWHYVTLSSIKEHARYDTQFLRLLETIEKAISNQAPKHPAELF